jgi:glycosyltransferase involved in cell wall biosynthesis
LAKANRKIISYCYIIVTEFLTRRLFSKVFVISSEGYNYAQDYLKKGDTDCILYTPNTFIYNYEQEQRESVIVREQMVKNNEQIILVVSRLEKEKGVDRALQLFSRSIAQGLNARLLIIGNGSQQATLWRYIKDNNFEDKIIHIPFVQHDSLWRYYLASDVLLLCSRSEGLGLVGLIPLMPFGPITCLTWPMPRLPVVIWVSRLLILHLRPLGAFLPLMSRQR